MLTEPEIRLRGGPRNFCRVMRGHGIWKGSKPTGTAHENALHRFRDVNKHPLSYTKEEEKDTIYRVSQEERT